MLFKGSRYERVPQSAITGPDGRVIRYTTTRFIPEGAASGRHRVTSDERLDHIAWRHFRDSERFWRICDANRALWPPDLLEEGAVLRIPTPEG